VLQRADGTYVGTAVIETNGFPLHSMVAFTLSGQLLWSEPNYVPQIATSGGGTIATSLDGSTTATFDANGNKTGKAPNLSPPSSQSSTGQWPSWLGNVLGGSYTTTSGAAALVASATIGYATTYAAVLGGNHGGTGTSVQQEWFPNLPSCPGAATPCTLEALGAALDSLRLTLQLQGACPECQTAIFTKLPATTSLDQVINQAQFATFLGRRPAFFDGTRSNASTVVLCGNGGGGWGSH
jgi:hypothetical protein